MPIGTALHPRTSALCQSGSWRDWSGYLAASSYEVHHEHEYNAIRNAAALIDVSPLFKYRVSGPDASRLVDRVVTRDISRLEVGQVAYAHWCDARGKVLDDGTLMRLEPEVYRWTAAEPNLRWLSLNASGLDVRLEDLSDAVAALALQGPSSRDVLRACAESERPLASLGYFSVSRGRIAGAPVEISRTGYTGDLGYEIWMQAPHALRVWDVLIETGRPFGIAPTGLLALDVARIEAGLILLDVDYVSARKALIPTQKSSPYEIGLERLVHLDKPPFVGQSALRREAARGPLRRLVGLEIHWEDVERLFAEAGLPPQVPTTASRVAVPVYSRRRQVGKATSTTWSPILKKLVALASVRSRYARPGSRLEVELTVDDRRRRAAATVTTLPFFDPPRKRAHG